MSSIFSAKGARPQRIARIWRLCCAWRKLCNGGCIRPWQILTSCRLSSNSKGAFRSHGAGGVCQATASRSPGLLRARNKVRFAQADAINFKRPQAPAGLRRLAITPRLRRECCRPKMLIASEETAMPNLAHWRLDFAVLLFFYRLTVVWQILTFFLKKWLALTSQALGAGRLHPCPRRLMVSVFAPTNYAACLYHLAIA